MNKKQIRDLCARAGWTFLQAFLAAWIILDEPFTTQALIGAVGAGMSALKTFVIATK